MEQLYIRTLGEFSIQAGQNKISDHDNRTRKIWMLLAYLIFQKGHPVSQGKLIELLWGEEPSSTNPENALRITFHRARTLLNHLWPNAGKELLLYKDKGYAWNMEIPSAIDADRFDALCQPDADGTQTLTRLLEALDLYRGEFLKKQSSEIWVIPVSAHYHNQYIHAAIAASALLSAEDRHSEAVNICRAAIKSEPYQEQLYQILMQELAATGDQKGASAAYEALSKHLFDDFGIRPSEQTRAVYRSTALAAGDTILPMEEILEHLQEPELIAGAMQCDYDYFMVLCYAQSRDMERSGNVAHVVLLSATAGPDTPMSKRTLHRIMEQLGIQIRTNLRRGDIFSRCSTSQYIIMLPKANYENSCMVSRRVIAAFRRAHPHITVQLHYMVQPLTPSISVP